MRRLTAMVAAFGAMVAALPASATVDESGDSGFSVSGSATVDATAQSAWEAFTRPSRYWNGEHSWSGDAANLSLDLRAGGCFCEVVPGPDGLPDGSVEHMRVIYATPFSDVRLRGSLGPLQGEALTGVLAVNFAESAGTTTISWTYVVGGHARFPLADVAPAVDMVLAEQMNRLADMLGRAGDAG